MQAAPRIRSVLVALMFLPSAPQACAQVWTQTSAPTTNWTRVACSADGSKVVAPVFIEVWTGSGYDVFPGPIYISTNSGISWTATSAPITNWNSVCMSADGSTIFAEVNGGPIYLSTNSGANWSATSAPIDYRTAMACSTDGVKVSATQYYLSGMVYLSTNSGTTWTNNYLGSGLMSVACSADGNTMVVGAYWVAGAPVSVSTDGGWTWTDPVNADGLNWNGVACSADAHEMAAASPNYAVYISTNSGSSWLPAAVPTQPWSCISSSADGRKLAVASTTFQGSPGVIYSSSDSGMNWASNSAPNLWWQSIASSADGETMFAIGGKNIYVRRTAPRPGLNVTSSGTNILLSWLVPSQPFTLEQSSDLATWSAVGVTPALNYGSLRYEVGISMTGNKQFFRLVLQ